MLAVETYNGKSSRIEGCRLKMVSKEATEMTLKVEKWSFLFYLFYFFFFFCIRLDNLFTFSTLV